MNIMDKAFFYLENAPEKAWALYLRHRNRMWKEDPAGCAVFCSELSEIMLSESYEKAIMLINDAFFHLPEAADELDEMQICFLGYRYAAFHVICCEEYKYLKDLEEIFDQLDEAAKELAAMSADADSEECDPELVQAASEMDYIRMNIAYILLVKTVYDRESRKYLHHAHVFYDLSQKYDELVRESPALNHKVAAHYLACVYAEMGEDLVAESYMKEAAELCGEYPNDDVDFYVLFNLLLSYLKQNYLPEAKPLAKMLADRIEDGRYSANITPDQLMAGVFLIAGFFLLEGSRETALEIIQENLFRADSLSDIHIADAVYRTLIALRLDEGQPLTGEQYWNCRQCLEKAEGDPAFGELTPGELLEHWGAKMLLYWNGGDLSIYEDILKKYTALLKKTDSAQVREITLCSGILAAVAMKIGEYRLGENLAGIMLSYQEQALGRALVYQNRKRLEAMLNGSHNPAYLTCYSLLRETAEIKKLYSIVLNWKDPLSLVTVFRNETVEKWEPVREMAGEINRLMDQQADQEVNLLYGKAVCDGGELRRKLEELEYRFARTVRGDYEFKPFRTETLMEKMPDNTAFLDYFSFYEELYNSYLDPAYLDEDFLAFEKRQIDIFCFAKVNGVCRVNRFRVPDMTAMQKEILFCRRELGKRVHKKLDVTRRRLYEELIKPAEKELRGVERLLIAPDEILNNLPFAFLTDEEGRMLGEQYEIVMVNSGRDLLRKVSDDFGEHFLVVGNPAYDIDREREKGENVRKSSLQKAIKELPFSELEAYMVADELGCVPCVGMEADKSVVDRIGAARWAHLATHGISDINVSQDAWYSSALLFAGAENWRRTGLHHKRFGNGMVTADEISRMKLKHTELVVLSACFAGRVSYSNLAGIRSAFRDAGVKYVVSALWEVDDIAAAIFMERFYRYLMEDTVPAALWKTKEYLRRLTVGQAEALLKEQAGKYQDCHIRGVEKGLEYLAYLKQKSGEDYRVYEDPYYWSAFICVQNHF